MRHWVRHTGGPKVLEAFAEALELPPRGAAATLGLAGEGGQPLVARRCCSCFGDTLESGGREAGRPGAAARHGPGLLLRAGAAAMVTPSEALYLAFLGAARRWSAAGRARALTPQRAARLCAGRRRSGPRAFPRDGATPRALPGGLRRRSAAAASALPRRAGLARARRSARRAGPALLGHRRAGRPWNTRVIVVPGAAAGHARAVPLGAPPQLRRGGPGDRLRAADSRRLDHGASSSASPTPPC